jgi:hypothetical protein
MVSCFSSISVPAASDNNRSENAAGCFGSWLNVWRRSRSLGCHGPGPRPHFRRVSDAEFNRLYKVGKTIGVGGKLITQTSKIHANCSVTDMIEVR